METTTRDSTLSSSGISGNHDGSLGKAPLLAHGAVSSLAETANEVAQKAKPAIDQVAAMAHKSVDKAADAVAPAADWFAAKSESLKATQKKVVDGTYQYVSENPLKSLGIAVLAGFLISRVSRIVLK
jgi:ElaB/YqjD/DUF883 family membrane-anchored ribosome-binding protein